MPMLRRRVSLRHNTLSIAGCAVIVALGAWMSMTAAERGAPTTIPAHVLISTTHLDMSRLTASAFGDWD